MARSVLVCALIAVLAAAPLAAADAQAANILGKGMATMEVQAAPISTGKGDVNVDIQCTDVCNDVCTPVPSKVCNDIPYQTQVCNKVPVQKTKQVCNRICTKTTVVTEAVATPAPTVVSSGKGGTVMMQPTMMAYSTGKGGRRLAGTTKADVGPLPLLGMLLGKTVAAKAVVAGAAGAAVVAGGKGAAAPIVVAAGKGAAPQVDVQCNDACNDVPYTEYATQCQMVQQTKTKCDIVYNQKCDKVCKPSCKKVTTTTTVTTQMVGNGKGATVMPMMTMGKGH